MEMKKLDFSETLKDSIAIGVKNAPSVVVAVALWLVTIWIPYINIGTTIAISLLPVELLMQETPVRFDIHFLRECRYGQTLSVGYEQRGRTALFEIRSDEGTPAVRASIEWK